MTAWSSDMALEGTSLGRACWGCGTRLYPPKLNDGRDAPKFKCTWCLAINEPSVFRARTRRARLKSRYAQLSHVFARWGGYVLSLAVILISCSIGWAQARHLAPVVGGESLAINVCVLVVMLFFLANVFFNYFLCAARHPGTVDGAPMPVVFREDGQNTRQVELDDASIGELNDELTEPLNDNNTGDIPRGQFANCVPCVPCAAAKPKGAHHCSTCMSCVVGMDHHCPFVANCVGADTMRHFLLFVLYVSVGNFFGCVLCFYCRYYSKSGSETLTKFWELLQSRKHFEWGWLDAREEVEGGDGVFGSKWLSYLIGESPGTVKKMMRSGSFRAFLSLMTHYFYFFFRGLSRIVNVAFSQSPDWVGWWAWQLVVGGVICVCTALLFWSTLQGVAGGETFVERLKSNASYNSLSRLNNSNTGAGLHDDNARLMRYNQSRIKALLTSYPPVVADCLDCVSCGCITGSAGPAPWSKIGLFHLRQVFGNGKVLFWGAPLWKPPIGAWGSTSKKGK